MSSGQRIPSLDGLRGLAALTVVATHGFAYTVQSLPLTLQPGHIAVRMFFVLSGALITFVLLREKDEAHDARVPAAVVWWRFALRRALRIAPLAWLAIGLAWLVGVPAARDGLWWYVGFVNNLAPDPVAKWPGLAHLWTLAVEEQVYLVWPLIVLAWARRGLVTTFIALAVLAVVARAVMPGWVYFLPPAYGDAFALGALVTMARRAERTRSFRRVLGWGGTVVTLLTIVPASRVGATTWAYSVYELAGVALSAWLVSWLWERPAQLVFSWRPLAWLGTISYGVYVWHEALPMILGQFGILSSEDQVMRFLWRAGLGIGGATLTWYAFERPILRLKNRLPPLRARHIQPSFSPV